MSIGDSDFNANAEIRSSAENGGEFDAPPTPEGQASDANSEFDAPPLGGDDGGDDGGDIESSAAAQRVRDAKGQIEQRLAEAACSNAMSLASARNIDSAGVLGVGLAAGGDFGSIIWQCNTRLSPVGLLFAGGGGITLCKRMSRVVRALDITLFEQT